MEEIGRAVMPGPSLLTVLAGGATIIETGALGCGQHRRLPQDGSMMANGVSLFLATKDTADLTVTSPGSTTCTSISSAPRPPRSPSATRSGTVRLLTA
jgi:hypothetical protein